MRKAFDFSLPVPGKQVPDRPEWIHEVKHDGCRFIDGLVIGKALPETKFTFCPF
jgi:hypothetical protein